MFMYLIHFFFFNIPMKEIVALISCFMLGNTESS